MKQAFARWKHHQQIGMNASRGRNPVLNMQTSYGRRRSHHIGACEDEMVYRCAVVATAEKGLANRWAAREIGIAASKMIP